MAAQQTFLLSIQIGIPIITWKQIQPKGSSDLTFVNRSYMFQHCLQTRITSRPFRCHGKFWFFVSNKCSIIGRNSGSSKKKLHCPRPVSQLTIIWHSHHRCFRETIARRRNATWSQPSFSRYYWTVFLHTFCEAMRGHNFKIKNARIPRIFSKARKIPCWTNTING